MNYLGIDVAKAKLDVCLLLEDSRRKSKVVSNSAAGFAKLLAWCKGQGFALDQLHAVAEATGCYHRALVQALFEAGMPVSVVNPARARKFAESQGLLSKTDAIDAFALARFGQSTPLRPWQPLPPEIEHLQALLARRQAVAGDLQRERNRKEKAEVGQAPASIRTSIDEHIAFLERELKKIDRDINEHIKQNAGLKEDRALLQSIPGVGSQNSARMLVILRQNNFATAEQVAAYLGLVPVEKQSGSSVRARPGLSKNGPAKVRATLYMAAVCAKQHNPHIKAMSERLLKRGKSKLSVIGAAMRKLVHLCFGVLKHRIPYQANFSTPS